MDASRRPDVADPEFDASPGHPNRLRIIPPEHQRLVVNPFLAVLGLIGLAWLAREVAMSAIPSLTGLLPFPILVLPHLIQYHCLDCGGTGRYTRRTGHVCPGAFARWRAGDRSRFPFPTSSVQLVIWGWLLGAAAILLAVTTLT